jgi:hypothetical protein
MSSSSTVHTFLQAALEVLRHADRPLTTREITDEANQRGLLTTAGKTPEASMSATLYMEHRRDPDGRLKKLFAPGPTRARRGSVRWTSHE